MLIQIDSGREITYIPHIGDWNTWRGRLTPEQWQAVRNELNARITAGEVHTAGWMPGADWNGTPFQPLYDVACRGNADAAALCFGLAVWVVMMEHPARWGFGRYEKDGIPIRSLTYFKLDGVK